MKENPLDLLMNPRSIAVVGAGNNPMKMGTMQALNILKDGFQGAFYPIHPREKEVLGCRAYPSVSDLPDPPDLAMLIVPTASAVELLEEFGRLGTPRAIIISAGFKETGEEGAQLEKKLQETARKYGIRFLGPNCMGVLNSQVSLNMTVIRMADGPGMLGMATQSGTYVTQTLAYLRKKGIRFSKAVSVGNEADLNIVDALEYLGQDEQTRAIGLYIEGIREGRRFIEAAQKITPHKPVLAQYVGGSAAGARAGRSHTGSMAGPDYLYEGVFKQAGIIRVHSIEDIYEHGWTLAAQPLPRGKRVGVVTNSGGPGTAIAHTCNEGGMEVPPFSEGLQERIREHLPPQGSSTNPVDLTFHLDVRALSTGIPELIMQSGEVDAVALHGAMSRGFMKEIYPHLRELLGGVPFEELFERFRQDLSDTVSLPFKYDIPLVVSSFFEDDNYAEAYRKNNVPVFDVPEKAARALLALYRYKTIREREKTLPPELPVPSSEAERLIEEALARGQCSLDEYDSKRVLAAYGIPLAPERRVQALEEAVEAAEEMGFPVVLKGCSPDIAHKSERGLIKLGLKNRSEVQGAYFEIAEAAGEEIPVLVSEMVRGERELLAGVTRFPGFGPCVLFGLGGVFTEALGDFTIRAAPLSRSEAEEMLADVRGRALLEGFRGLPPADREELARILQNLGALSLLHPRVAEIDLNPIILSGSRPVVVDALVVLEREAEAGGGRT